MKVFWFLLTIFYAIILNAVNTLEDTRTDLSRLTDVQTKLVNELSTLLATAFNEMLNSPQFSLEEDDLPLEQNLQDDLPDGNSMFLYNVVIDGLYEIEDDNVETVYNEHDVRIAVNLKQLVIHGEYALEKPAVDTAERSPFGVTLTNARIEGIAYLLADKNYDNREVTKVVSSVKCEESHVWVKSAPAPCGQIMALALKYVEKNVEKRFARIAILEVNMQSVNVNSPRFQIPPINRVLHEARRFVSQRYDPHTFRISNVGALSSRLSPLRFHGFSDFHLAGIDFVVNNNSVDLFLSLFTTGDLYGNFSFFSQQECVGQLSIEQIEFIGKIRLMADDSIAVPIVSLGAQVNNCLSRIRNKATGMFVHNTEFGLESDEVYCMEMRNEISGQSISNTIQSEIFKKVDISYLKGTISEVIRENNLMDANGV